MKTCKYPYCEKSQEIAGYCQSHYAAQRRSKLSLVKARQEDKCPPAPERWHCVYIIGCNEFLPVKVGRSKNVMERLLTMQTGCPYQLKLHQAFFAPKSVIEWLEWDAHRKLHDFGLGSRDTLRSEWFDVDPDEAAGVVKKCADLKDFLTRDIREYAKIARERKGKSAPEWIANVEAVGFMAHGIAGA